MPHPHNSCHSVITPHAGFVEYTLKAHSFSGWLFYCKYSLNWLRQSTQLKKAIPVHIPALVAGMDSEKPWSLFLGRLQLLLKDSELKDMATEFNKLLNGDAATLR